MELRLNLSIGDNIDDYAVKAIQISQVLDMPVLIEFNDGTATVTPASIVAMVVSEVMEDGERARKARHEREVAEWSLRGAIRRVLKEELAKELTKCETESSD